LILTPFSIIILITDSRLGIVIPGSRIPGSRMFFSIPNPGIGKALIPGFRDWKKIVLFCWKQHIFHDICYELEKKLFSHTLTVTLISTPAPMLQVATAFFHSWLTMPIATNERYQSWDGIIWQYWETRLLFGDKCTRTYWLSHQHWWKLKEHFPRREFSQLNCDHDLVIIRSTLCVSCAPFIFELSLNVTKPLGNPDCCTDYS